MAGVPSFLKEMLLKQYGEEITNKIIEGYSKKRKLTLRVNTIKTTVENIKEILEKENIEYKTVNWSKEALIIENKVEEDIRKLDIYNEGKIYMQSLSSMLPPIILDSKKEEDILDMCAAPGSKTSQIASLVENESHITACEMNHIRAERLKYNMEKLGASCVYIMNTDSRNLDNFFSFDRILLDAPCSGSGTISLENPNLEKIFTEKLIQKSVKAQTNLLKKAITILKPGKEMVYSTCSILKKENEEIVEKALKNQKIEIIPIDIKGEGIKQLPTTIKGTLCVEPNEEYEGFFIAKIKKIK